MALEMARDCRPLYERVGSEIVSLIDGGTFRVGERLPSIRQLSSKLNVSINTVMQAYAVLEDRRVIQARPQSGYYVCPKVPEITAQPLAKNPRLQPTAVTFSDLCELVIRNLMKPELLPLASAVPNPLHFPVDKLNRMTAAEMRRFGAQSISYMMPPGSERLRTQIAKRSLLYGVSVRPDQILVTSGCVEAVQLALRATCKAGDTIAVESPFYFNFLQLIAEMGLKALEIPSTPKEGISIEALSYAIENNKISACLVIPNFSNPLGTLMPDERKRELVQLLAQHDIPLIEDDIYGDLTFAQQRPIAAKSFDHKGLVIYCSSFSKTLAPGYRVGWAIGGKFQAEMERLKMMNNLATASPTQLGIAEFLATGGYDHHLRAIRRLYAKNASQMTDALVRYFPEGTRMTRPGGGFMLWVEMPEQVDSVQLFHRALERGISITPGAIFSLSGKYRNFIRLSTAFWDEKAERGVETLGGLVKDML
ncbi:aminotransferase-like domain-containing protein [Geomonas azotofigens]|uniref:aminotransferase-like domain-containing protein n=1 Tax=Geomonas azotofigens TaxID=2843196 RepID=UPI001C12304C|nr:PLP-dependent aminotransferase family protein [Geomonas azotofigens]MBU5615384.1 PLP-dependent aminotransferase family protein [Geomonas azotofigens]